LPAIEEEVGMQEPIVADGRSRGFPVDHGPEVESQMGATA
jgi:hypothetical protein